MRVTIQRMGDCPVFITVNTDKGEILSNLMHCVCARISYTAGSCIVIQNPRWENFLVIAREGRKFTDDEIAEFFSEIRRLEVTTPLIQINTDLEPTTWE